MELGNDSATGNAWRVIESHAERRKRIDEVIWKGNGKEARGLPHERALAEVREVFEHRAGFIQERFPNADRDEGSGDALAFSFKEVEGRRAAHLRLAVTVKESKVALLLECQYRVGSDQRGTRDYVTLPVTVSATERARRFVEGKLCDFARDYLG